RRVNAWRYAHGSALHRTRGRMDGGADPWIRGAAADVAAHGFVNVGCAGLLILRQQRCRRHDLAGLAIAALRNLQADPGRLHRLRGFAVDAFDGGDVLALDGREWRHARARRNPFDVNGAGAALRDAAAVFG